MMGVPVRIDKLFYEQAKAEAKIEHRTIGGQIQFWAMVGRAVLDNPDLPVWSLILKEDSSLFKISK
jgi:hypothetical protein